jgi:hypothetical protein
MWLESLSVRSIILRNEKLVQAAMFCKDSEMKEVARTGHVASVGRYRMHIYKMLVGNPLVRRRLGRPRKGWKDTIKVDLT